MTEIIKMKKILVIIILAFALPVVSLCQNWAPIGAKWYYDVVEPLSQYYSFVKYEVISDTMILGHNCRAISATGGDPGAYPLIGISNTAYTYDENGKIYVYDPSNNDFSLVYDFSSLPDESWVVNWDTCSYTRVISDTGHVNVNGYTLKTLSVGNSVIYERIGGISFTLFHTFGEIYCTPQPTDLPFVYQFRCYEDNIIGLFNNTIYPCDYIYTGIEDYKLGKKISIYPNPVKSEITVSGYSPAYLKLCDAVGQTVAESISNKLYVGNLSQGLYVLQVFDANGQAVKTEKVIVVK